MRPREDQVTNPMIVHIAHFDQLEDVVSEVPEVGRQLMDVFWPGPMTLIMKKNDEISDATTGGLDTVRRENAVKQNGLQPF